MIKIAIASMEWDADRGGHRLRLDGVDGQGFVVVDQQTWEACFAAHKDRRRVYLVPVTGDAAGNLDLAGEVADLRRRIEQAQVRLLMAERRERDALKIARQAMDLAGRT